ncbi:MAG: aminopeptidase P family protein [Deltaproteobacteria bacterium]|nr:aminopeptidase P family protein [Deltaproteobacteria bacterium]
MKKRQRKLWQLVGRDVDGLLITSLANVRYLSGFSGTEGTLVLTRKEALFFTDGRYTTQAQEQVSGYDVITFTQKWKDIGRVLETHGIRMLGVEARDLSVALQQDLMQASPQVSLKLLTGELDPLRVVKDSREITILRKAALIAAESLQEVVPLIQPGIRELELAAELEFRMRRKGGSEVSFQTIVASGVRSALPHGLASEKKIEKGDFVTIDYGLVYHGYSSDETCTFVVGRPTKKQLQVYDIVKQAHDRAIKAVRPGKKLKQVDLAARRLIDRAGYGNRFTHGTGHGVGLCVHEPPTVSFRSQERLCAGMVLTVEPGIYIPGWGGVRIEDTVVVTEQGSEYITRSDKTLTAVPIS